MAFRQQHPPPLRQLSFPVPHEPAQASATPESPRTKPPLEEEWVLFSPSNAPSTTKTRTTSTERTPRTAGLSRLSDFGSLDTAARSDQLDDDDDITCQGSDFEEEAELDSLDDGLRAFHEPSEHGSPMRGLDNSGGTVLPTHDGLGTFPTSSALVQEQLWQFEQYNPRRKTRRRSSVQRRLDALEEAEEYHHEHDRRQRIEKWRLEQSRALLEEIERETRRRRRMSRVSAARSRAGSIVSTDLPTVSPAKRPAEDSAAQTSTEPTEDESWWTRFTRRVIRDLMGIDENILQVIFGEELPADAALPPTEAQAQKEMERILTDPDAPSLSGEPWQHRLLERIARELGILVHQLSEHPGAFSTYIRAQEAPSYAGITPTPRRMSLAPTTATTPATESQATSSVMFPPHANTTYSEASLWGIEEEPEPEPYDPGNIDHSKATQAEREYWERELDVKMVFNFLKHRFSSRPSSPSHDPAASKLGATRTFTANTAPSRDLLAPATSTGSSNPLDSARRAALIRQHHPLANRGAEGAVPSSRRRDVLHRHNLHYHQPPAMIIRSIGAKTASSSCASQSTKKSKRSGSSRNYWDLGGSVGSGPASPAVWGEA